MIFVVPLGSLLSKELRRSKTTDVAWGSEVRSTCHGRLERPGRSEVEEETHTV